jgi:hypothetical protein
VAVFLLCRVEVPIQLLRPSASSTRGTTWNLSFRWPSVQGQIARISLPLTVAAEPIADGQIRH